MSAIKLRKILSLCFSLVFVIFFVILFPLTTFAMVATPSDAIKVPVATSSNALLSQDYMETDDFDTLDVMPLSDGDLPYVSNTVDVTGCYLSVAYYDMSGKLKFTPAKYFNSDHYASIGVPSDCASVSHFVFSIEKSALPSSGVYSLSAHFASNTGVEYKLVRIYSSKNNSNVSTQESSLDLSFTQSSGDWYCTTVVDVGTVSNIQLWLIPKSTSTINLPYGGFLDINFTKTSATPNYTAAGGSQTTRDIQSNIADNTAQQVEQGDTIIELIKNTIQTISFQLTSFWNQLAGEFTNLYNKMNTQHAEQLEADRMNTDNIIAADDANTNKVTTAIESHGNFIIEGLKKLFIPSDEYFKAYFDDLYSWFSERFGFLSFPIDLLLEVIDIFVNSSQTDCVLVLPSFTIMENLLWPEMSFNLTEFLNTNFSFVVVAIKTVTSIYLVMAFVQLCEEKWNEVMMN